MILESIFAGSFVGILYLSMLAGCVAGYRLRKKGCVILLVSCIAGYLLCELMCHFVAPLRLMPADMLFMFLGYISFGLTPGVALGGAAKAVVHHIRKA